MKTNSTLVVRNKSEVLYLCLDSILYVQADGNYCNIFLTDGGVINTLTYQRAEIARMIERQHPTVWRRSFALLGRSYLINTDYVLRIQPGKQQLTFSVNIPGTRKKMTLKATAKALDQLIQDMARSAEE